MFLGIYKLLFYSGKLHLMEFSKTKVKIAKTQNHRDLFQGLELQRFI